ncbi:MAG: GldG family protein [Gammaproteobacteria bacterium]|nr:GldG family protein [Gammaproteobacteria bacterium]
MDVTRKTKIGLRLQRYSFTLLFLAVIGLLAWLSMQYVHVADWTASGRNSLAQDSVRTLALFKEPVQITAFARENEALRGQVKELVARYKRHKPDIELSFVNPDAEPERVRELGVTMDGELRVAYQGRSERVQELSEQALTNALLRTQRQGERWIAFLSGHGERDPRGQANHDLGSFGSALERKGLKVQSLNLTQTPQIPDNISLLVIPGPQAALLPGEIDILRGYLDKGGNLLWLTDPNESAGLDKLAEYFGIETLPGIIVDASTQLFGIQNPDFVLVTEYPAHPVTRELRIMSLFPHTAALAWKQREGWEGQALLSTLERAWTETGELSGEIRYDAGGDERAGPLDIGFVLTRARLGDTAGTTSSATNPDDAAQQQRVIVVGDGDFLSNAYLGNGGNLDLGLNMVHWLSNDDSFIAIRAKAGPDRSLALTNTAQAVIGAGFLFGMPLALLGSGVFIWLRRRKR